MGNKIWFGMCFAASLILVFAFSIDLTIEVNIIDAIQLIISSLNALIFWDIANE